MRMKQVPTIINEIEREVKKDFEQFQKKVEKGITKLAGGKDKEYEEECIHCRLWKLSDEFINAVKKELL